MAATIRDVAREAGVSLSTVSYALSGKRSISPETRDRIEQAIARLGFTPNAGARALATAQTKVLGLFLQFQEDEFAPAMLQYVLPVSSTARVLGYDLLMVTDSDMVGAIERTTSAHKVDGVVLLDVTYDDVRLAPLAAAQQPGVLIGFARDGSQVDSFDLDFGEAARLAVDHLADLGHRELVLITPPKHVYDRGGSYAWRFRDAAVERAARYGMRIAAYEGESRQPGIDTQLDRALGAHPNATGLIVHNDATVASLPSYLNARGVAVPRDLSVVGVFSHDFGTEFSLPYTAVETLPDTLGELAVKRLVERIASPSAAGDPIVRLVEPKFIERDSTRRVE